MCINMYACVDVHISVYMCVNAGLGAHHPPMSFSSGIIKSCGEKTAPLGGLQWGVLLDGVRLSENSVSEGMLHDVPGGTSGTDCPQAA